MARILMHRQLCHAGRPVAWLRRLQGRAIRSALDAWEYSNLDGHLVSIP